jgi:hypothetical protein
MPDIPKIALEFLKHRFLKIHWTKFRILKVSLFVLFFCLYFGSGAGTFYEFFSFVSHHLGLLLIGIFSAVVGAWYLSKYHNALYLFRKDVQIKEKKAERDPDNPEYAIPLASSYRSLSLALKSRGKTTEAASYNSKAEEIEQRLKTFYGELNTLDE